MGDVQSLMDHIGIVLALNEAFVWMAESGCFPSSCFILSVLHCFGSRLPELASPAFDLCDATTG
eukprot:9093838-Pyramimonas_sp.AAC.1